MSKSQPMDSKRPQGAVHGNVDTPARAQRDFRVDVPGRLGLHVLDWPGRAPTVVLIHSNRALNREWDLVVAESRLANRFLAPGLRGHGRSDAPPRNYRLIDHRDDIVGLLKAMALGGVCLVGQGIGAIIALMVARSCPDLVHAVMAANPSLTMPETASDPSQPHMMQSFRTKAAARAALPNSSRWSPHVVEHYLEHALETTINGSLRWRYFADGVRVCEEDLLNDHTGEIETDKPVLVIGGAEASVLTPGLLDRVCALLPNHTRATLEGADLRLCQDNPAGFARLLDWFVGDFAPAVRRA